MLKECLASLDNGSLEMITPNNSIAISKLAIRLLSIQEDKVTKVDLDQMLDILKISNILYNNTNRDLLPLEDGVYDLLVVKYDLLTGNKAPVGARPIHFNEEVQDTVAREDHDLTEIVRRVNKDEMLYFDALTNNVSPIPEDFIIGVDNTTIERRVANVAHAYPELVGTLEKCKFTTVAEALNAGVEIDHTPVMIFERDFLGAHRMMGIGSDELILELKYDGISVEAEIDGDEIISARTRGDTKFDEASDLTPLLGGYKFHRASGKIPKGTVFGLKFEAIITYEKQALLKSMYGKSYVNARTAISGLTGSLDSRKFKDFITLVPIASSGLNIPERQVEIEFLNKFYSSGVNLRYQVVRGDFPTLVYQVSKFVNEAEYMRPYVNFMYDGVVVSYTDPAMKDMLGRVNSINRWSIAIKFNALKKQTIFTEYDFTVGQDGRVTPIAYFKEVEFLGTIHNHATVHSLKRFNLLSLRKGDVVDTEYRNDVMVYVSKPNNSFNAKNSNPIVPFPTHCPYCGNEITTSDTGDSAYCTNFFCSERVVSRMSNMLKKLNVKDFSESAIRALGVKSLSELLNVSKTRACDILGEVNGSKLMQRFNEIKTKPYPDYRLVGSLGFTSMSAEKWKLILRGISLESVINKDDYELRSLILITKGLGSEAANTVVNERKFFIEDLKMIASMKNVECTFGVVTEKVQIRFTGCRDEKLESALTELGFDADGNKSVTKKTSILIIPYPGFTSTKMNKINPACKVITVEDAYNFLKNAGKAVLG